MTRITLERLPERELSAFKEEMQEAFQVGAEKEFGSMDQPILPESDIDHSLQARGALAYQALPDSQRVGGAIIRIDEVDQRNHLDFLYVIDGATHVDLYYKDQYVDQAIQELVAFFGENLWLIFL